VNPAAAGNTANENNATRASILLSVLGDLICKCRADQIAMSPNKATFSDRGEIVERQFEDNRQYGQIMGPKSGAPVREVDDAAAASSWLTVEEQQRASADD
jgi:hypothetical protein